MKTSQVCYLIPKSKPAALKPAPPGTQYWLRTTAHGQHQHPQVQDGEKTPQRKTADNRARPALRRRFPLE
ncbi:MAG: hypothetical protein H6667_07010 [Ardenticatenaceae bacterium]|nr:hypothetical protein [Ardenticatenaceae bacterium]